MPGQWRQHRAPAAARVCIARNRINQAIKVVVDAVAASRAGLTRLRRRPIRQPALGNTAPQCVKVCVLLRRQPRRINQQRILVIRVIAGACPVHRARYQPLAVNCSRLGVHLATPCLHLHLYSCCAQNLVLAVAVLRRSGVHNHPHLYAALLRRQQVGRNVFVGQVKDCQVDGAARLRQQGPHSRVNRFVLR